jgi:methionine synthase II (cobalamin-independent)
MLTTTVIGSRPNPDSLSSRNHDTSGWTVDRDWEFQPEELKAKQGEAIEWAARQQEAIGVDVVSDEEQRCDNYVSFSAVVWMGSISIIAQSSTNALGLGVGTRLGSRDQLRQPGFFSLTTFASHRT